MRATNKPMQGGTKGPARRVVLEGAIATALLAGLVRAEPYRIDAIVGGGPGAAPRFPSLQQAIAAAPADGRTLFRILVSEGRFREKIVVDRPFVHLIGASRTGSVITFDAAAGMPGPDGRPWGTWGCATLIVRAPNFAARNLTIENAFDYVADLSQPRFERVGSNGAQAVALMLDRGADRSAFEGVDIIGHQDTLFVDAGLAAFRDCSISGSVDFIFGAGRVWFERCELKSRYRPLMQRNHGWIAVPSTPRSQQFGLVFRQCRLTREPSVPPASVALGRPWRPTRTFPDGRYGDPDALGQAAFLDCWMDDHISADGWDEMGYAGRDGARVFLSPSEARFGEYGSQGSGAFANRRRAQLSADAARGMSMEHVLDGWRP